MQRTCLTALFEILYVRAQNECSSENSAPRVAQLLRIDLVPEIRASLIATRSLLIICPLFRRIMALLFNYA